MFKFANQFLPLLGYGRKAHLINPLLPALSGVKMSSSNAASSKVEFLDAPETVTEKVLCCQYDKKDLNGNALLAIVQHIIMPLIGLRASNSAPWDFACVLADGTTKVYQTYDELHRDCLAGNIDGDGIKTAVASALNSLLQPVREAYATNQEWQELADLAYPACISGQN